MKVTILSGASLSNSLDLGGNKLVGIIMPTSWTTANLTFQGAVGEDDAYQDIYDTAGNELVVTAAASRILVDIPELSVCRFLKIRSGTTGTSVNQDATRNIKLLVK